MYFLVMLESNVNHFKVVLSNHLPKHLDSLIPKSARGVLVVKIGGKICYLSAIFKFENSHQSNI